MNTFLKQHGAVVLAFALPLLLIAGVALFAYLPNRSVETQYDFLYATCGSEALGMPMRSMPMHYEYLCDEYMADRYRVENGTLSVREVDPSVDYDNDGAPDGERDYEVHLFVHDTKENASREVNLEEATALSLSGLLTSPDGVSVNFQYDRGADVFPFFYSDGSSYGPYLTKGDKRTAINLIGGGDERYYYRDNILFLGWVLPGRGE